MKFEERIVHMRLTINASVCNTVFVDKRREILTDRKKPIR